jgi:hypothetical protein
MKTYKQIDANNIQTSETHEDGSFTSGLVRKGDRRKGADGNEYSPWDELLASGETIEPADPPYQPYQPTKREIRSARYAAELSAEGDAINSIGDCLDALIKAVVDGDMNDLIKIKTKIDKIKNEVK